MAFGSFRFAVDFWDLRSSSFSICTLFCTRYTQIDCKKGRIFAANFGQLIRMGQYLDILCLVITQILAPNHMGNLLSYRTGFDFYFCI